MGRILGIAAAALLCFTAVFYLNNLMVDVQWEEMEQLLSQRAGDEASLESATLWGRLELLKNRLRYGEAPVENYVMEARIQALTASIPEVSTPKVTPWRLKVINLLRTILGRQILVSPEQAALQTGLEEAYLLETTRKYTAAADIYSGLLETIPSIPPGIRLRIELHLGYCLAFAGDRSTALETFRGITSRYPSNEGVALAHLLVSFLEELDRLSQSVSRDTSGTAQIRGAYLAMDYAKALDYFDRLTVQDDPQARYYKARSQEELGRLEESQSEYRRVVFLDPQGDWGREARRRLFMQDRVYDEKSELTQSAAQELTALGDTNFIRSLSSYPGYRGKPEDPFKVPAVRSGELYVETDPPGAEISLNGVKVGVSPLFITEVPVGTLLVEARKGVRRTRQTLIMSDRAIRKMTLTLAEVPGSLMITSPHNIQAVYMNEKELTSWTSLPAGNHSFLIQAQKSNGEIILWEGEVRIQEGTVSTIEVP